MFKFLAWLFGYDLPSDKLQDQTKTNSCDSRHSFEECRETKTMYGAWYYCKPCRTYSYDKVYPFPFPQYNDPYPWCPPGYYILKPHECNHCEIAVDYESTEAICIWCGEENP